MQCNLELWNFKPKGKNSVRRLTDSLKKAVHDPNEIVLGGISHTEIDEEDCV